MRPRKAVGKAPDSRTPEGILKKAFLELGRAAMRSGSLAKAAQEFLDIVVRSVQAEAGTFYAHDDARDELVLVAQKGLGKRLVEKTQVHRVVDGSQSVAAKTAFLRRPVYVQDLASDPAASYVRTEVIEGGFVSLVSIPLVAEDMLLGVFQVVAKKDRHFEKEDLGAVRSLSEQMAATLLRLKLDAEARANEQYLANIMTDSADGIIGLNSDEEIVSWNRGAEALFGYTADQVLGRHFSFLVPDDLIKSKEIERLRRRVTTVGYIQNYETERVTKEGRRIIVSLTRTLIKDADGRPIGSSAILRDITEKKKLEERVLQSERLATIGRMSAKVAHEIRNPLSSISLNSELLEEEIVSYKGVDSSEAKTLLKSITKELDRLTEITDDYLRFAKLPAPHLKELTVNRMVSDLLSMLEPEMEERGVKVERQLTPRLPKVKVDQQQLRRALLNMFKNSLEAMPEGGVIRVSTSADTDSVLIQISDTGAGIKREHMDRIFTPFFSTKEMGTGLGLPLAQQIVAEHGGEITCSSELGKGASFVVALPVAGGRGRGQGL
jgi:PAS domain S-box-containing protein